MMSVRRRTGAASGLTRSLQRNLSRTGEIALGTILWTKDQKMPLAELMVLDQFLGGVPEDLRAWLKERKLEFLHEESSEETTCSVVGSSAGTRTPTGHRNSNSMTITQLTLLLQQARGPTTTLSMRRVSHT